MSELSHSLPPGAAALALLTPEESARADRLALAGGVPMGVLMDAAGRSVAREVARRWSVCPVAVLCGPGNNGGDGFVAARVLREAGWPVRLALLGSRDSLSGDAAAAAARWEGPILPLSPACLEGAALAVDALFGAGLNRPLSGLPAETLAAAAESLPLAAVDVPSGLDGATGRVLGFAPQADLTVTFFRLKPGHKLLPGRDLCGEVVLADIGIPATVLGEIAPRTFLNRPGLWEVPLPGPLSHKYDRGHLLVAGGGMTGATRLATRAARRIGAGLVTVVCPPENRLVFAMDAPGAIVLAEAACDDDREFGRALADRRRNAVLIGPGHGVGAALCRKVLAVLAAGRACVLDADALTAFAGDPGALFAAIAGPCILTPHAGEFARLFPDLAVLDRLAAARAAAARSHAVVVLKGSDTVIADPSGLAAVNDDAPPWLATGGTGDVLAGLAAGLLAQGMGAFAAAAAAVWIHGRAATLAGPGLIAEDLPEAVPAVLRSFCERPLRSK